MKPRFKVGDAVKTCIPYWSNQYIGTVSKAIKKTVPIRQQFNAYAITFDPPIPLYPNPFVLPEWELLPA